MTNEEKKEFNELMEYVEETMIKVEKSEDKEELKNLKNVVLDMLDKIEYEDLNSKDEDYKEAILDIKDYLVEIQIAIMERQEALKIKKDKEKPFAGIKLGFVSSWFKDQARKIQEIKAQKEKEAEQDLLDDEPNHKKGILNLFRKSKKIEPEEVIEYCDDEDYYDEDSKDDIEKPIEPEKDIKDIDKDINDDIKSDNKKKILMATGAVVLIAAIAIGSKAKGLKALFEAKQNNNETTTESIEEEEIEETKTEEITEEAVETINKEEALLELAGTIQSDLNKFEGLNVSKEQTLALLIHLNVGNSYMNGNELALDRITLNNMIKKHYVGLIEGTEDFDSYTISDADLTKVTNYVQELRNELVNYVIVLNDEGRYDESKAVIETLEQFITDETLQDEAITLTENVMSMQSSKVEDIKKGAYRWYNYIFAGPKKDVRNFDDYGYLYDGDEKVMTFENQEMTMRFYTWFLDTFVDIQISGKNIIPQDIINSKEVKLMDQANIMRALGYKNCTAWSYSTVDFDNALEKQGSKSKRSGKTSGTTSSSSNISHATGNTEVDEKINQNLQQNSTVGSTSTLPDGSTMTVIESGDKETTVVITPDPSSEVIKDTTPSGPSSREEIVTGGGNETRDEIHFEEDNNTVIIEEGGEVIYSNESYESTESYESSETSTESYESTTPVETIEEIHFEEETTEVSSIRDQIELLNSIKSALQMKYPNMSVTFEEEPYQKTLSC